MIYFLLIPSAICVCLGDYLGKLWSISSSKATFVYAMLFYSMGGMLFILSLKHTGLVIANMLWTCSTMIGFLFIGLYLFNESLTTLQTIGIAFGAISILLLSL